MGHGLLPGLLLSEANSFEHIFLVHRAIHPPDLLLRHLAVHHARQVARRHGCQGCAEHPEDPEAREGASAMSQGRRGQGQGVVRQIQDLQVPQSDGSRLMAGVLHEQVRQQGDLVITQVELLKGLEGEEVVESRQEVRGQVQEP
jgi:hypothetical protein